LTGPAGNDGAVGPQGVQGSPGTGTSLWTDDGNGTITTDGNVSTNSVSNLTKFEVSGRINATEGYGRLYRTARPIGSVTPPILIKNAYWYRVTVKSSDGSGQARQGVYLLYGIGLHYPPDQLTVAESPNVGWTFSYTQNGAHDTGHMIRT